MYLSRISLDRREAAVRSDLRNCQDMHRSIMRLFGEQRQEADVLYRVRTDATHACVYILSNKEPSQQPARGARLDAVRDLRAFEERLVAGASFAFDLLCMPSKKIAVDGSKNSRRRLLKTEEERLEWLRRKAAACGFEVLSVREAGQTELWGLHESDKGAAMRMTGIQFTGLLRVTDTENFRTGWRNGIGAGKPYGLGMLMLTGR